jgi:phasin family protein
MTVSASASRKPARPARAKTVAAQHSAAPVVVAAAEAPAEVEATVAAPAEAEAAVVASVETVVETLPSPPTAKVTAVTTTETIPGFDDLTAFGKANIEAMVEANSIFVRGVEEISKELFGLTRSSIEQAAAATNAILAAKTLKDVAELNADFAKSQYEKLIANTTRIGELTVKLATESSAPITARAHRVVETVARPAA